MFVMQTQYDSKEGDISMNFILTYLKKIEVRLGNTL